MLSPNLFFIPVVLGLFVAGWGVIGAGFDINCARETPRVTVTSPEDGSRVPYPVRVQGTSSGFCNSDFWVFVQSHKAPQFHPQPGPTIRLRDQSWTTTAYLGTGAPEDRSFEIIATSATRDATKTILDYLARSAKNADFPGFPVLPDGVTAQDRVSVMLAGT